VAITRPLTLPPAAITRSPSPAHHRQLLVVSPASIRASPRARLHCLQLFTFSDPITVTCHTAVIATHWLDDNKAAALRESGVPILVQVGLGVWGCVGGGAGCAAPARQGEAEVRGLHEGGG
jgi:hypothetical protein